MIARRLRLGLFLQVVAGWQQGWLAMRLSPFQLAREQRELSLDLPLAEFPRLEALVLAGGATVSVRVRFFVDEHRRCCMEGRLETRQSITCANCEQAGAFDLVAPVDACLLTSDASAQELLGEVDPLILAGPHATPAELFEDDLLLALPERPCRSIAECPNQPRYAPEPPAVAEGENPFAVLAKIKTTPRSD